MTYPIIPTMFLGALEQIMFTEAETLRLLTNKEISSNEAIDGLENEKFKIRYFNINHEFRDETAFVFKIERQKDGKLFEREIIFDEKTGKPRLSQYNNKIIWTETTKDNAS